MKLKLLLQILLLSCFSYLLPSSNPANPSCATAVQGVATTVTLSGTPLVLGDTLTFSLASSTITTSNGGTVAYLVTTSSTSATVQYTSQARFLGQDTFDFTITENGIPYTGTAYVQVIGQSVKAYITDLSRTVAIAASIDIIDVINTAPITPGVRALNASGAATGVALTPNGSVAYVSYGGGSNRVAIVNTKSNSFMGFVNDQIGSLNAPYGIAISPDGSLAYVCNNVSASISIFTPGVASGDNIITQTVQDSNFYIFGPTKVAFTPDGLSAYGIGDNGGGNPAIFMIDTVLNSATVQITANVSGNLQDIAISPDGNFGYIVGQSPDCVYILDINPNSATYNTILGTIHDSLSPTLSAPTCMAIAPNGLKAYVANNGTNTISIVDLNSANHLFQKITGSVSNPGLQTPFNTPSSIAFTADGSKAYVINNISSGFVSIIDVASDTVINTLSGYSNPNYCLFIENSLTLNQAGGIAQQNVPTTLTLSCTPAISGDSLTFSLPSFISTQGGSIAAPVHNTSTSTSATVQYTPPLDFIGQDTFDFTITEGGASYTGTAYVQVIPASGRAYIASKIDFSVANDGKVNILGVTNTQGIQNGTVGSSIYVGNIDLQTNFIASLDYSKVYYAYNNTIQEISTVSNNQTNSFTSSLSSGGFCNIALSPDGTQIYCAESQSIYTLESLDLSTGNFSPINTTGFDISTPICPQVVFTPDGLRAYFVAWDMNTGKYDIFMVDVATFTVVQQLSLNLASVYFPLAMSRNGNFLYMLNNVTPRSVNIIDINPNSSTYNTVVTSLANNSGTAFSNTLRYMAIAPNGLKGYITDSTNNCVYIADLNPASPTYQTITGIVQLGSSGAIQNFNSPLTVAFTADGSQAYVSNNTLSGFISVIDVASNTVINILEGYYNPQSIAFLGNFPTAYAQTVQIAPNSGSNSIQLTGYDPAGESLIYTLYGAGVSHGVLGHLNALNGSVSYAPNNSYAGPDSFQFTVTNTSGVTSFPATVSLAVASSLPVATAQTVGALNGVARTFQLSASGGSGSYTYALSGPNPAYVTLPGGFSISSSGLVSYTANQVGLKRDQFSFTVTDSNGITSAPATVNIIIEASAPVVTAQAVGVTSSGSAQFQLFATGGSGIYTNYTVATGPTSGTLSPSSSSSTGIFTYTNTSGSSDTITFRVTDSLGVVSTATGTVTVNVGSTPFASAQTVGAANGILKTFQLGATGGTPPYTYALFGSAPANTTGFSISSSGIVSFTPTASTGARTFQFKITDSAATPITSAAATVTINFESPPVATTTSFEASATGGQQQFTLFASGGTAPYTFNLVSGPTNGSLAGFPSSTGFIQYTPGLSATASFVYTVSDRFGVVSNPQTVNITITGNLPPVGTTTAITASPVLNAVTNTTLEATGGSGTYSKYTISGATSAHGTISQPSGTGSSALRYTSSGTVGTDTFSYTVTDSLGLTSSPVTVTITADTNPTATTTVLNAAVTGGAQTFTLGASGGTGTYTYYLVSGPATGSISGLPNSTGIIQYTPTGSSAYTTSFVYNVTDSLGVQSSNATVTLNVDTNPTVTTPVAVSVPANSANNIIIVNGTDALAEPLTFSIVSSPAGTLNQVSSTSTSATYHYTPVPLSTAPVSFTFQATNTSGLVSTLGTVNITITSGGAPIANSAFGNTIINTPIYINLSGSDSVSPSLLFSIVSPPSHGTISSVVATGDFTAQAFYTPNVGYTGTDSFTFEVYNGSAYSSPATASIEIISVPNETLLNKFVRDAITKYSGT